MTYVIFIDRVGWGFIVLGFGLVMMIIDLHKDPRRSIDAFMRSLVIMCVAIGSFIIIGETLPHTSFFDEQAAPSLSSMSQSMV